MTEETKTPRRRAPAPAPNPNGYAMLEFGSRMLVLPADDAAALFTLLCRAEVVDRNYDSSISDYVYKREKNSSYMPTLKVFPLHEYASLCLND